MKQGMICKCSWLTPHVLCVDSKEHFKAQLSRISMITSSNTETHTLKSADSWSEQRKPEVSDSSGKIHFKSMFCCSRAVLLLFFGVFLKDGLQNRWVLKEQTLRLILKLEFTENEGHLGFFNWLLILSACFRYLPHFCVTKHAHTNQISFIIISAKEFCYFKDIQNNTIFIEDWRWPDRMLNFFFFFMQLCASISWGDNWIIKSRYMAETLKSKLPSLCKLCYSSNQ